MGINEEYCRESHMTGQQIKNTDKEEDLCKKISIFGCCIIVLLLLIYIVLILIVISLNN